MPSFLKKTGNRYLLYLLIIVSLIIAGLLSFHSKTLSILALVALMIISYFVIRAEMLFRSEAEDFIQTFSQRFNEISEEAIAELPTGVLLYNENREIEWSNRYMQDVFEEKVEVGKQLSDLSDDILPFILKKTEDDEINIDGRYYKIQHKKKQCLIYLTDVTDLKELSKKYREEKPVICMLFLDNYDDLTQGMDDQKKSSVQNIFTSEIMKWAKENEIFLRRVSSDRFVAILNEKTLEQLEKTKFNILDEIRVTTMKNNVPLTLSIGVGSGVDSLNELGVLAQSSLDLALGRGGDQAVIKMLNGKARFYGGKTSPTGKRTRVRARVISHALRDLIIDSENVIIMGHKHPDLDVYGPAIGLLKVAEVNDRPAYVVMDKSEMDSSVENLLEEVEKHPSIFKKFVSGEAALDLVTEKTLLIIIDTHKPSLVIEEKLLKEINKVVVIDHHRRGEEVINNPILTYMEPYASSTAELVSELIEYHPNLKKLEIFEATALLAGIVMDTKSFTLRTGARTFDAASYLRFHGADPTLIQNIFKEDIEQVVERNKLIENVYFYKNGVVIATGENNLNYKQVQIAKAADSLLTMEDVAASLVIGRCNENMIAISSRSLGEVNVQLIMEELGGGGHLTNAAAQLQNKTIEEAEKLVHQAIETYYEGRE